MRGLRRWLLGLLGALAALSGRPAWPVEADDPPCVANLPLFAIPAPPPPTAQPQPAAHAAPAIPRAVVDPLILTPRWEGAVRPPGAVALEPLSDPEVRPAQVPVPTEPPVSRTPATPEFDAPSPAPVVSAPPSTATPAAPAAPGAVPGSPPTAAPPTGPAAPGAVAAGPPSAPGATTAGEEYARISAATNLGETAAGAAAGAGANLGFSFAPVMIGDQAPPSGRLAVTPTPPPTPTPPRPPTPPVPSRARARTAFVPWIRGFKIADNQSPRPQDRFFFSFNYFNDLNGVVNRAFGSPISHEKVYRELFGFEKTIFGGNASIGIRMPLDTLTADSTVRGLGGTNTAVGNLTVFAKAILWQDQGGRNLISGGLAVTAPNGPARFAGSPAAVGIRDADLQPFIGYIFAGDRWYIQGFEAIDVPTDPHDVTMQYNDIGVGYFIYRSNDPHALVSSIAPTFETHVNIPLNHVGVWRPSDPLGTPNVVDLTYGVNMLMRRSAMLTAGFVNPVTGPRPFSYEWQLLLNVYFGRTRARAAQVTPTPPIGGS